MNVKKQLNCILEQSSRIHIGLKKYISPKKLKVKTPDTQLMMTRYEEKQEDITLNKDFKKAICLISDKDTKMRK